LQETVKGVQESVMQSIVMPEEGRESLRQVRSPPPEDWMPLCILVC
jgi:hypothetical protein